MLIRREFPHFTGIQVIKKEPTFKKTGWHHISLEHIHGNSVSVHNEMEDEEGTFQRSKEQRLIQEEPGPPTSSTGLPVLKI